LMASTVDPHAPESPASSPMAAIDLGTNTILMVVGRRIRDDLAQDDQVEILDDAHVIARMGKGVDEHRRVQPETIDRVCQFLRNYRIRAEALGAQRVCAFGTSALRDAANQAQVIEAAGQQAGVDLVEVSGLDEARLTFQGAAFGLQVPSRYAVIDIGGGSTEVAVGTAVGQVDASQSVDVGAVRVTERFFSQLPPTPQQIAQAREMILAILADLPVSARDVALVGVAGTVTTLGAIDTQAPTFDAASINGHVLSLDAVRDIAGRLLSLPHEQIQSIPQISDQRADIISAGALILQLYMELSGHEQLIVSTRGIRYGLLLDMLAGRR